MIACWERDADGWTAVIVYVITDVRGQWRVVSETLPAARLRPHTDR